MGPPRNGKHNLFTEVVDIAINFNDFFASAFRQEHVKKILAKRHVFAYIMEKRWNKYQARAMRKLLNYLISGKLLKKLNMKVEFRQQHQSLRPVGCLLKPHALQDAAKEPTFLDFLIFKSIVWNNS